MIIKLIESLSNNIHIYTVTEDGIPEIGKPFIAFLTSKHEKYVIAERLADSKIKSHWDDPDGHKGTGNAFYADKGSGGHIYGMQFERYIYVDELNLIPQSHYDKVAIRNKAKEESRKKLVNQLTAIYGTSYGNELAKVFIDTRGTNYVEIIGSAKYLLEAPGYAGCYKGLYEQLCKYFSEDEAQEILFQVPYIKHFLDSYPDRIYFDLSDKSITAINALAEKPFNWLLSFDYISSLDTDGNTLICTPISLKHKSYDLIDYLKRTEGLNI